MLWTNALTRNQHLNVDNPACVIQTLFDSSHTVMTLDVAMTDILFLVIISIQLNLRIPCVWVHQKKKWYVSFL